MEIKYALRFSRSRHLQWSLKYSFSLLNLLGIYLNLPTVNFSGEVSLHLKINKIQLGNVPLLTLIIQIYLDSKLSMRAEFEININCFHDTAKVIRYGSDMI